MPWYEHGRPFEGYTVVIVGQGPSVVPTEVTKISSIFPTVAIKDTYRWAPKAQIIYACDRAWWFSRWRTDEALREHPADKVVLDYQKMDTKVPGLYWLKCGGNEGFDYREGYVCHGRNSGHQALNMVVNMGPSKIILMGYDMREINGKMHCDVPHVPVPPSVLDDFYNAFMKAVPSLLKRNVQIVNTSAQSRITCFPKLTLEQAIEWGKYV